MPSSRQYPNFLEILYCIVNKHCGEYSQLQIPRVLLSKDLTQGIPVLTPTRTQWIPILHIMDGTEGTQLGVPAKNYIKLQKKKPDEKLWKH
jgi:hypothetical protein